MLDGVLLRLSVILKSLWFSVSFAVNKQNLAVFLFSIRLREQYHFHMFRLTLLAASHTDEIWGLTHSLTSLAGCGSALQLSTYCATWLIIPQPIHPLKLCGGKEKDTHTSRDSPPTPLSRRGTEGNLHETRYMVCLFVEPSSSAGDDSSGHPGCSCGVSVSTSNPLASEPWNSLAFLDSGVALNIWGERGKSTCNVWRFNGCPDGLRRAGCVLCPYSNGSF